MKSLWSERSIAISQSMRQFPPAWANRCLGGSSYTPRANTGSSGMHGGEEPSWKGLTGACAVDATEAKISSGGLRGTWPLQTWRCPFYPRLPSDLQPGVPKGPGGCFPTGACPWQPALAVSTSGFALLPYHPLRLHLSTHETSSWVAQMRSPNGGARWANNRITECLGLEV